jgi:hypothetical protein
LVPVRQLGLDHVPTGDDEPWYTGPACSGTNGPDRAAHTAGP